MSADIVLTHRAFPETIGPPPTETVPVLRSTTVLPGATPFKATSTPMFPNETVPDVAVTFRVVTTVPTTGCPAASDRVPVGPSVMVWAPVVSVPFVIVKTPWMTASPASEAPLVRLSVRLFNVMAGRERPGPDPPTMMIEEVPPTRVPVVADSGPLSVSVWARWKMHH